MSGEQIGNGRDETVSTGDLVSIITKDGSKITGVISNLYGSSHQNVSIKSDGYTYIGFTSTAVKENKNVK